MEPIHSGPKRELPNKKDELATPRKGKTKENEDQSQEVGSLPRRRSRSGRSSQAALRAAQTDGYRRMLRKHVRRRSVQAAQSDQGGQRVAAAPRFSHDGAPGQRRGQADAMAAHCAPLNIFANG